MTAIEVADARAAGRADRHLRPLPGPRARPHPGAGRPRSSPALGAAATGSPAMTQNEWLAIAPFLLVSRAARCWSSSSIVILAAARTTIVDRSAIGGLASSRMAVTVAAGPLAGSASAAADGPGGLRRRLRARPADRAASTCVFIAIALLTILVRARTTCGRAACRWPSSRPRSSSPSAARMLIAGAQDLLILFLGLELLVLPGYMLAGYAKRDGSRPRAPSSTSCWARSPAPSSCSAWPSCSGFTGTTSIAGIADALSSVGDGSQPLPLALAMGLALLTAGVALQDRRGALPLLDARRLPGLADAGHRLPVGRPQGGRLRAHPAALRGGAGAAPGRLVNVVVILAALTMTLGNLVALGQDNIKRMLAYSSIAHTGYIMVGLAVFGAAPSRLAGRRAGPPGRALLQRRVRVHEPRRLRRAWPRSSAGPA